MIMTKKTSAGFNLDKAISRISRPSIFDRIVKEVEAKQIPARFIESIVVQYYDGNIVELSGKDLTHPIPVNKDIRWDIMEESFKKIRDIKIFISTDNLEIDVNLMVEEYLGKYC
jgi:hypothetical protein